MVHTFSNLFQSGEPKKGNLANNADPGQMQLNAAFDQGLHCLQTV